MKQASPSFRRAGAALGAAALCLLGPASAPAAPAWWSEPATSIAGNTPVNDWAAANLGQLKHVATQAKAHLDSALASIGGAGPEIDAMCQFTQQDNYAPAAVGQLKNVAKVFYDRLAQAQWNWQTGYPGTASTPYPWTGTVHAGNAAPINIGQLKNVFSFDLSSWASFDQDADSMADGWEVYYGLNPGTDDSLLDADDDGITNLDEFNNQTSPVVQNADGITLFSRTITAIYSQDSNSPWFPPDAPVAGLTTQYILSLTRSIYITYPIGSVKTPWFEYIQPPSTHAGQPAYSQLDTHINPQWFHPRAAFHLEELPWPPVDPVASAVAQARPSDYDASALLTGRMLWLRAPARPDPWKMVAVLEKEGFREQLYPSPARTIPIGPDYSVVEFPFPANSVWSAGVPVIPKLETPRPRNLLDHSGSSSPGSEHTVWRILPIDIEEVISDQIAGNEANKLPTPHFGGQPNNPMLMGTRSGSDARLMIKMNVPAALAASIRVGVREYGQTAILNSAASVAPPGRTPLSFTAPSGSRLYEIIAGYDANSNAALDPSEATFVFQKTPKTNTPAKAAEVGSGAYTGSFWWKADKIIIVTQDDYNAARTITDDHAEGTLVSFYSSAAGLLKAFARGAATVPGVPTAGTTWGHVLDAKTIPSPQGLSYALGGKWTTPANNTTTCRFEFPAGGDLSGDVADSNGIEDMISRLLIKHKSKLAAGATSVQNVVTLTSLTDDKISFAETDKNWQVHVALGQCRFEGGMEVKVKKGAGATLEVLEVNCWGALFDLYDWDYHSPKPSVAGIVVGDPEEAAKVQAGYATLAAPTPWPDAGRVFFTKVSFGTGWKDYEFTIP